MSANPVPVLHVIRHMNMGGAQRQIFHLVCGLDRTRFEPIVVCLHREEPLLAAMRSRGVEAVCVPARRRGADLTLPGRLADLARRRGARILQSHLFAANAWGRIAARLARLPVAIATEHTDRSRRRRRELLVERALAPWTSGYVVVSASMGRTLARQVPRVADRIAVVPNGVDLAPFGADRAAARATLRAALAVRESVPLVGVLANLTPDKGHRFLLQAMAKLPDGDGQAAHLVLIGEGPERAAISAIAERLGLDGRVSFLGHRDDVPGLLLGLDLLAQPSVREGMPVAILEGMAAGLPIVATDVGGTAEALAAGECGLLVPPADADALGRGISTMLGSPERAARWAAAARRRAQQEFAIERMIGRTEELYARLLAGAAGRSPEAREGAW